MLTSEKDLEFQVRSLLTECFGLEKNYPSFSPLFTSGNLDSLNSMVLIAELEKRFSISISPFDVTTDDIDNIDLIVATIKRSSV